MTPPQAPQGPGLPAVQWEIPTTSDLAVLQCQRSWQGQFGDEPGFHRAQPWKGSGPPGRQRAVPPSGTGGQDSGNGEM